MAFAWSAVILTIVVLLQAVTCQRIPLRSGDPSLLQLTDAELYVGSKMLPDGVEISSYLQRYAPSRYYFMVDEEKTPLEIVVTPCDSSIVLKIFIQSLPPEGSANGSDDYEDDLFRQYNSLAHQPTAVSQPIKTYSGSDVMKFRAEPAAVGIYVIEIMAEERDSSVRMSASTSPFSDLIYPELPRDAAVTSRYVARSAVELSWKPSPSAWRHGQPIDYCIVVNRVRHFPTHCAARAFKYGDLPPTAAPDAGFRFSWQRTAANRRKPEVGESGSSATNRKSRKTTETTAGDRDRKRKITGETMTGSDVIYECVNGKTRFVFNDVIGNGATYYYDVFAVNRKSNASATYVGTRVVANGSEKTIRLKEGKLTAVHLKRSVSERSFVYNLQRKTPEVTVQIHPCSGQLNVSIQAEQGGTLIQSLGNVTHLETIRLRNARPGQYIIRVAKEGRRPRSGSFRIFASPEPAQSPYPSLPRDLRLKTFEKLNTCSSITVAWMGTSRRQKYCLYAVPMSAAASKATTSAPLPPPTKPSYDRCLGHGDRPKTEKLLCRHFRAANDRKSVMTETVRKLKPRTIYLFTVYAVKSGGLSLPYEHLTVKTKDTC